jgi:hypothetical protein
MLYPKASCGGHRFLRLAGAKPHQRVTVARAYRVVSGSRDRPEAALVCDKITDLFKFGAKDSFSSLEYLEFRYLWEVSEEDLEALANNAQYLPNLKELRFTYCGPYPWSTDPFKAFLQAGSKHWKKLEVLDMRGDFDEDGIWDAWYQPGDGLRGSYLQVFADHAKTLCPNGHCWPNLRVLNLIHCHYDVTMIDGDSEISSIDLNGHEQIKTNARKWWPKLEVLELDDLEQLEVDINNEAMTDLCRGIGDDPYD